MESQLTFNQNSTKAPAGGVMRHRLLDDAHQPVTARRAWLATTRLATVLRLLGHFNTCNKLLKSSVHRRQPGSGGMT